MNITVIGSGNMGSAFVKQLTRTGHRVYVMGRNAAKAQALAVQYGASCGAPASDDPTAKGAVSTLARSMGFEVMDDGGLRNARYLEPLGGLNVFLGYGAGLGTAITPCWLRKG